MLHGYIFISFWLSSAQIYVVLRILPIKRRKRWKIQWNKWGRKGGGERERDKMEREKQTSSWVGRLVELGVHAKLPLIGLGSYS